MKFCSDVSLYHLASSVLFVILKGIIPFVVMTIPLITDYSTWLERPNLSSSLCPLEMEKVYYSKFILPTLFNKMWNTLKYITCLNWCQWKYNPCNRSNFRIDNSVCFIGLTTAQQQIAPALHKMQCKCSSNSHLIIV